MKPASNTAPVSALAEFTTWHDLEDAIEASVQYQSSRLGKIIPLMFFAPRTVPANPDAWEPMTTLPLNLLIVSIERSADATMRAALRKAEAALSGMEPAEDCPALSIDFDADTVADVYEQMEAAGARFHAHEHAGKDEASYYFARGGAATRAFDRALREVTRSSGR